MRKSCLVQRAGVFGLALAWAMSWMANVANAADPIAVLRASNGGPNDRLGVHIAADGDVMVVGASFYDGAAGADQGAVYVYVRPAGGWRGDLVEVATLLPSDPVAGQQFGHRVAINGDTIVVGASGPQFGGDARAGAVYVFVRPHQGWTGNLTETARLLASDGLSGDGLGADVTVNGPLVLAGASADDVSGNLNQGSAYVFLRPLGGWSGVVHESGKLIASDGLDGDLFGSRVAIAGGSLVVSAPYGDRTTRENQGAAYVFNLPANGWSGTLNEDAKLTSGESGPAEQDDNFGSGLAAVGDTIVVSDCKGVPPELTSAGAFVFERPEGGWYGALTPDARLFASDEGPDLFGCSLALSPGGQVLVGAALADVNGLVNQGAAYRYQRPDTGWSGWIPELEKVIADDGVMGDRTGIAVAFAGEMPIVSAPFSDIELNVDQGRVLVFTSVRHTLTVQVSGPGTVESSPNGIVCADDCSAMFPEGTVVSLVARARIDSEFTGWGGDDDCSDGSVTVNADTTCTATFVMRPELQVRIDGDIGGRVTIDPPGIECRNRCTERYSPGTRVLLTATPDADYEFSGWSGSPVCANEITLDVDTTCIATFTHVPLEDLVVWLDGEGRVTSVPAGIDCTDRCGELFPRGTAFTLTATPDAGWVFAGWGGSPDCSDGRITLNSDLHCVARFTQLTDLTGRWRRNVGWWCTPRFWRPQLCIVFGELDVSNRSVDVPRAMVHFLLSADAAADNADVLLSVRQLGVPVAATRSVGFIAVLPPGLRPEGWRLLAVIDPDNDVAELDEGNNVIAAAPF